MIQFKVDMNFAKKFKYSLPKVMQKQFTRKHNPGYVKIDR